MPFTSIPVSAPHRLLAGTMGVLLVTDLAGGLLEIAAGRNTVGTAWGSEATLCAPYPMIIVQVLAVVVVTRSARIAGRVAAVLLALACFVSFLSGFFDGQLARPDLGVFDLAFQWWLLGVTGLLGCLAAVCLFRRGRSGLTARPVPSDAAASGREPVAP
jgi:hypothetical protein